MIRYPEILNHVSDPQTFSWNERDAILYALCLGYGDKPTDDRALRFIYEKDLQVVPTFPSILAWVAQPTFTELGINPISALHGEQTIELHRPIPIPANIRVQGRVLDVYDKGPGRGAVVVTQHMICDAAEQSPIAVLTTTCFARDEGGCGAGSKPASRPHQTPTRTPDMSIDFPTRADLALLYRLTGDRNPIHADPEVARSAGFALPLLHGLCTFGITCRAVLQFYANYVPFNIALHSARFAAPAYPGETLTVDLWRDLNIVSFQVRVRARDVTVVTNGKSVLRGDGP
jgi:acyl dehydratase